MRILYVAEITGKAGIACCKKALPRLKAELDANFVIAGADAVTNGAGLGCAHAAYLRKLGCDALTLGECAFYKKDLTEALGKFPSVLRPANLVKNAPGHGWKIFPVTPFAGVGVAVLLGQSHFSKTHGDNPYVHFALLVERLRAATPFIIIDFHAEATAEKQALFALAEGKVSAVIGSHTRIQTADERISGGTATISCAGRTGSIDSVGGCNTASRINEYRSGIPDWTRPAWERCELQGVILDLNSDGSAASIERLQVSVPGILPEEQSC